MREDTLEPHSLRTLSFSSRVIDAGIGSANPATITRGTSNPFSWEVAAVIVRCQFEVCVMMELRAISSREPSEMTWPLELHLKGTSNSSMVGNFKSELDSARRLMISTAWL